MKTSESILTISMDKFQAFGKNISSVIAWVPSFGATKLKLNSSTITPWTSRTQQYFKEQIGTAEDKVSHQYGNMVLWLCYADQFLLKTELPSDYIELEKRVDALKQVHQKLLSVTYILLDPLNIPSG